MKGKIVVCIYNYDDPSVTARVVGTAGGVGAILYLPAGADPNDVAILKFTFPAVVVSNAAGVLLRKYLASTRYVVVDMSLFFLFEAVHFVPLLRQLFNF